MGTDRGNEAMAEMEILKKRAIRISLFVGIALMLLKFYVYRITGSAAILSDALESIINVVAAGFAMYSISLSGKPPDDDHPYGHGKIEYFSAGFEGALILIAAIGIFKTGIQRAFQPEVLTSLGSGLLLLSVTCGVNFFLGLYLIRTGGHTGSLALTADGKHVMTDVITSAGVLVGLGVVSATGWFLVDGIIACLVGVQILVSGCRLIRKAFAGLMNEAEPAVMEEIADLLVSAANEHRIDTHQLRAWSAGDRLYIDFHLIMPRFITTETAHDQIKALESLFSNHFDGKAELMVHIDPCTDENCLICRKKRCAQRKQLESEPNGQR